MRLPASRAYERSYQTATIEAKMPPTATTPRMVYRACESPSPSAPAMTSFRLSGTTTLNAGPSCTAGVTAYRHSIAVDATAAILCDRDEFGKIIEAPAAAGQSSASTLSKNE